ncbi:hypothetical protein E1H99_05280 [Enterococcus hirae]|nr:hypothetical protein E1H99_05280 [Enterococcus hirae]
MDDTTMEILLKKKNKEVVNAEILGLNDEEYIELIKTMELAGLIQNVTYASNIPIYFDLTEKGKNQVN